MKETTYSNLELFHEGFATITLAISSVFLKMIQFILLWCLGYKLQSDDLDGEIDLTSCVNVSDCDVEKNYGLQIQVCNIYVYI